MARSSQSALEIHSGELREIPDAAPNNYRSAAPLDLRQLLGGNVMEKIFDCFEIVAKTCSSGAIMLSHDPGYSRVGERFLAAIATAGSDLRQVAAEDVQAALEAMPSKENHSSPRVRIRSSRAGECSRRFWCFLG